MKAWKSTIDRHIEEWCNRLDLRGWWPKYVYHFTDIRNAVSVLTHGALLPRADATRLGLMSTDNAAPAVIANTPDEYQHTVRLYFRPRTPTQYHNEGIRPRDQRGSLNAHCGVPVFFFFDAATVLALDETSFSDGTVASSHSTVGDSEEFFSSIPFGDVFSSGPIPQRERRPQVTARRHAEVLVKQQLPLVPHLKHIACRSVPERQTLLTLLGPQRKTWENLVQVAQSALVFERHATYVESVDVGIETVRFAFNPASNFWGPYDVVVEFASKRRWVLRFRAVIESELSVRFAGAGGSNGLLTLALDDCLAFQAPVTFDTIPF